VSPLRSSAGSSRSRLASFLATNAHFSSNWTSRVRGGNGDQLVVEVAGLRAGQAAVAADRAAVHLAEPAGLADAAALGDVLRDRFGLPGRLPGVEQRRAPALGEAGPCMCGSGACGGPCRARSGWSPSGFRPRACHGRGTGNSGNRSGRGRPSCVSADAIIKADAALRHPHEIDDPPEFVQWCQATRVFPDSVCSFPTGTPSHGRYPQDQYHTPLSSSDPVSMRVGRDYLMTL
jgi:hypothetical protein